jgi:RNA polymerase subunit RPABC4/transcription elongation factor Spt4
MPVAEMFRVNYFVGALLAQGGNLWFEDTDLVFSPTSSIDRAMGARDVKIPFQTIREIDYSGPLSRSFNIKTDDKIHKFEGSQAKKVWETLEKVLAVKGILILPESKNGGGPLACSQCEHALQPGFSFCPYCGVRIKSVCSSCHKSVEPNWVACAFCGWKFAPTNQTQQ